MNKDTVKKQKFDDKILNALVAKYGVGKVYLRQLIRGDRPCLLADQVIKDYNEQNQKAIELIEKFKNQVQ